MVDTLHRNNAVVGEEEVGELMELLDTDGNGTVELEEIIKNPIAIG